jgi:hypothetical protein
MLFAKYLPGMYQGADHTGRRVFNFGGGGGGPSHTTSTVNQSSIPDWLRPQTEAVLGAGMQEYFDTTSRKVTDPITGQTTTEYDITGTKPYTPYSTDPSKYFAGFTPGQEQVFSETANLQTPGDFGAAGQLMGAGGRGGLESVVPAYGYGQQAQQSGLYGQGIGFSYGQMATDPRAVQAYMSPYQQGVTDIAKAQAIEDAKKSQLGANLGAVRQGTYGGARQSLVQAQREAALQKQLSDIQTQGLQSAYDQAVKAQQFGVTSGIQGAQAGIQGAQAGLQGVGAAQAGYGMAGQLGQGLTGLGQARQGADLARLGFQGQMGDVQQQRQQDIINQQVQNFALAQEMPFQRLSGYNALLRGYATPTSTVSQYQAAPSGLSQLAGLGTTGAAMYGLSNIGKKAGGAIKLVGGGGITDKDALESFAERASIPQLQQSMQSGELKGKEYIGAPILQNKIVNEERMKAAQAAMAGGQQQGSGSILDGLLANADQLQGITDIVEPIEAAGGGVVAFAGGDLVRHGNYMSRDELNKYLDQLRKRGVDPKTIEAIKNQKYGLTRTALSKLPKTGIAGAVALPGILATDALMSTDTGVGDEADVMFSGITPGSAGPRTAGSALEAGQELLGALIPSGPGAETRAAQAEIDAQQEAQNAPAQTPPASAPAQAGAAKPPAAAGIAPPPAGQKMMPSGEMSVEDFKKRQEAFGISGDPDADLRKQIEDMAAGSKSEREQAKYMALLQAGLGMMGGTSRNALENIAAGAQKGVAQYAGDIKDIKAQERDVMKMRGELARAADARKRGDFKSFMDAEDKARKYELDFAQQATRDRIADIQENYYAGKLSADQAKNKIAQERLSILNKQLYQKAYKQYMDAGGESKLRTEFVERFGKNWLKNPEYEASFKQQMEAEIRRIAMMSDLGVPSADDLLGD